MEDKMIKKKYSVRLSLLTASALMLTFWSQASIANQSDSLQPCTYEAQVSCHEADNVQLPTDAIAKLQIDAGFGWGIFSGTIYNGNSEYLITQMTVHMTPIHDHHMEMMGDMLHEPKAHKIDLNLRPLSKSALSMALEGDDTHVHDFKWEILQVLGHKTR